MGETCRAENPFDIRLRQFQIGRENERSQRDIFQLADIAMPGTRQQGFENIVVLPNEFFACLLRLPFEKMLEKRYDVVPPLPHRS